MRCSALSIVGGLVGLLAHLAIACESCEEPARDVVLTRHVRRMQPDAQNATSAPKGPLAWGQLNFLHTTDTHGWLEGHLKEKNHGADWGDFVSFVKGMRSKADDYGVDLLVVDTGDLHDGAGLSDATSPNGVVSNEIFEDIDYDLLTIGNHELYVSAIAYEHFYNFSKHYGDSYLTSNVQIYNPSTSKYEYLGNTYKYLTTKNNGLNVMAFGVLYNFAGNSNASRVIKAQDMVNQTWFQSALHDQRPVDLYLIIGHNPVRPSDASSTFTAIFNAIRAVHPDTPVQMFGGHSHIRDFAVYDDKSTALESGRYCETLGWVAINGFAKCGLNVTKAGRLPYGVPSPTQKAVKVSSASNKTGTVPIASSTSSSDMTYFRRYLDWNRLTFETHARGSQNKFDTRKGLEATKNITTERYALNLTSLFGCAPATWCISCQPFNTTGSIFTLLTKALQPTVINQTRAAKSRIILLNTGSVRFDLAQGPFTSDDSFIVSPFSDAFEYIPDVPYSLASKVLAGINAGPVSKRDLSSQDFGFYNPGLTTRDDCLDPEVKLGKIEKLAVGKVVRRQAVVTPGYTTSDDFGTDGDDTVHSRIPSYSVPNYFGSNANFPADGTAPATVDLIFLDYIVPNVLLALKNLGANYTKSDVTYYLPSTFTTNSYLPAYAKIAPDWQANVPNCPVGAGIGSNSMT